MSKNATAEIKANFLYFGGQDFRLANRKIAAISTAGIIAAPFVMAPNPAAIPTMIRYFG
jgi:hypothetical protein